jgi:hypothetical protein
VAPGIDAQSLDGEQFFPSDRFQTIALLAHAVLPVVAFVPVFRGAIAPFGSKDGNSPGAKA